jgi:hypothetical protein
MKGVSTSDIDIVQMNESELEGKAAALFGRGTEKAKVFGLYLDPVPQGLPPLPGSFRDRCRQYPSTWKVLRLYALDPNDLAVTKPKTFRPRDREDLQFLCDRGLLRAERVEQSLQSAWMWTSEKDGDEGRERAFANFARLKAYLLGEAAGL